MKNKDNNSAPDDNINEMMDDVKEYVNMRMQLIQLNITEKISIALANLISGGATVIFLVLFFIFGSFALSYLIGSALDSTAGGFGVMAGFYLLVAISIFGLGKYSLRKKMINFFIREFTDDSDGK